MKKISGLNCITVHQKQGIDLWLYSRWFKLCRKAVSTNYRRYLLRFTILLWCQIDQYSFVSILFAVSLFAAYLHLCGSSQWRVRLWLSDSRSTLYWSSLMAADSNWCAWTTTENSSSGTGTERKWLPEEQTSSGSNRVNLRITSSQPSWLKTSFQWRTRIATPVNPRTCLKGVKYRK